MAASLVVMRMMVARTAQTCFHYHSHTHTHTPTHIKTQWPFTAMAIEALLHKALACPPLNTTATKLTFRVCWAGTSSRLSSTAGRFDFIFNFAFIFSRTVWRMGSMVAAWWYWQWWASLPACVMGGGRCGGRLSMITAWFMGCQWAGATEK